MTNTATIDVDTVEVGDLIETGDERWRLVRFVERHGNWVRLDLALDGELLLDVRSDTVKVWRPRRLVGAV